MQTLPLVSVVIPTYNSASHIADTLSSVARQTYPNVEVVVADDGSTDDTVDIVRRHGAANTVLRQENSGAAAARNLALRHARGEYVAFLDADDLWHPEKLTTQVRHVTGCHGCRAVFCRWFECTDETSDTIAWPQGATDSSTLVDRSSGWLYHQLLLESVIHTSTLLLHRSVIDEVGPFDEALRKGQDLDYWIRTSRATRIHKLAATLSAYRIHPRSITFRPVATNYRAMVIEKALKMYGLTNVDGTELDAKLVNRILARSWQDFGRQHLLAMGSARTAISSFWNAASLDRSDFATYFLIARAWLKSAVDVSNSRKNDSSSQISRDGSR